MNHPNLSEAENKEYSELWRDHGGTLVNSWDYRYNEKDDTYDCISDKHEWHHGKDVRRLQELAEKIREPHNAK